MSRPLTSPPSGPHGGNGLEQFMIVPILPVVQRTEGASLTAATWLLTGFLLAAVATAPLLGRLGDMYG